MNSITSLSREWLRLARAASNANRCEISPAVATIEVDAEEAYGSDACRCQLDELLEACGYGTSNTVATTIFPYYLWNPRAPRSRLFDRYIKLLPRIRKHNRRGVYFERLISYPGKRGQRGFNQLDHIITTYANKNHRRSALQASVLDPTQDLDNDAPVLGFPCMNQVGFLPNPEEKSLTVVAYYPMQYLFRRAYGNYLGLVRLGHFMAHEMGFACKRLICMAGVAKVEGHASELRSLLSTYVDAA